VFGLVEETKGRTLFLWCVFLDSFVKKRCRQTNKQGEGGVGFSVRVRDRPLFFGGGE